MAEFGLSEDIYLEIINDCFYNEKTDVVGNDNDQSDVPVLFQWSYHLYYESRMLESFQSWQDPSLSSSEVVQLLGTGEIHGKPKNSVWYVLRKC